MSTCYRIKFDTFNKILFFPYQGKLIEEKSFKRENVFRVALFAKHNMV